MKKMAALVLAFSLPVSATKFLRVNYSPDPVGLVQKFEISFDVNRDYDNPFNPTETAIDAIFTTPSGKTVTVPAFWYQTFDRQLIDGAEKLSPASRAEWRVRFAAQEVGEHSFFLRVQDIEGLNQSGSYTFTVVPSDSKGFVRVDRENPNYLSFDNGTFYFPMGQNVAWAGNRGTYDYDDWMAEMAAAGENWMRVWMTHFYMGQSLEWNASHHSGWYHGVGRYSLQGAWKIDAIVERAEQSGIYIQLVTQHHGQFSPNVNSNWDDNPYNVTNGGFLNTGAEFFTDDLAKEMYRRKMRYTVARWGYSTAILAWELWNEVQYTDNYSQNYPNVAAWHQEMAAYIQSIDPWRHLVTTSARDGDELIWALPEIDLTQIHYYGPGVNEALRSRHVMMRKYGKPNIIGEFGDNSAGSGSDPSGTVIHQALWATSMVGGGAMPWWWDNYIHPNNLYYHWAGLSAFWRGEDLRIGTFEPIAVEIQGGPLTIQGVRATPGKGWEASTKKEFWVQRDGSVPGIGELSQFLQGSDKPAMGREAIFHTDFAQDIGFALRVSGVSSWQPGILQIFLDDNKTPLVNETPKPPQRFEITVPAGAHRIRVFNAGVDWLTIDYFEFTGLPISAAAGYAFSNGQTAYAWIYDRDYENGASPHATLSGVEAILHGMAGEFKIEQWDPYTGEKVSEMTVSDKNELRIPLADFSADAALKFFKTGTGVRHETSPESFMLCPAFPNPFNASTTLRIFVPRSENVEIVLLNLLGEKIGTLFEGRLNAGVHEINWSAGDLPSGVYFLHAQAGAWKQVQKAAVLR